MINLASSKGLVFNLPFVQYAASLIKLFKEAPLQMFAHLTCRKHLTKSAIMKTKILNGLLDLLVS